MCKYGYARVSSSDQNLDRQIVSLKNAGVDEANIFMDKVSGKNFDRDQYIKMLNTIKPDDEIVITSLDRLGRNYDLIIQEWRKIINEKGAIITVLDSPMLQHSENRNSLTDRYLNDTLLNLLSYVAEMERDNIKKRQMEGIKVSKEKGVIFGRPRTEFNEAEAELFAKYIKGEIPMLEVLEQLDFSKNQFYYYLRKYKEEKMKIVVKFQTR